MILINFVNHFLGVDGQLLYCNPFSCFVTTLQTLKPSPQLFTQLSKVLKLTPVQEVVFGLALTSSANTDTQNFATQFVKQKLTELIRSYIDIGKSHLINYDS